MHFFLKNRHVLNDETVTDTFQMRFSDSHAVLPGTVLAVILLNGLVLKV